MSLFTMGLLFYAPILNLSVKGFTQTIDAAFWTNPTLWGVIRFTLLQAFASTLLSAIFGIFGAYLYCEHKFIGRRFFWSSALIPFSLPTILGVLAFVGFWGKIGGFLYGWIPILAVHTFYNYGLFVREVGLALQSLDRSHEKIALSLGASRSYTFLNLTLPKIWPAIRSTGLLCFLFCSSSFLIVLLLGGGPAFTTLEVAIYEAVRMEFDLATAVRLGFLQTVLSACIFFAASRRTSHGELGFHSGLYAIRSKGLRLFLLFLFWSIFFVLVAGPIFSLIVHAAAAIHHVAGSELLRYLWTSLQLAMTTCLLSIGLAFGLAIAEIHSKSRFIKMISRVTATPPAAISSMILSLSLLMAYPDLFFLGRGNVFLVSALQAVGALPLVYRTLTNGWKRIPQAYYLAAKTLGASAGQVFTWIEWPLLRKPLQSSALLAISLSLGEVTTVLLLSRPDFVPLPLAVFRAMGSHQFDKAFALGGVLIVLCFLISLALGEEAHEFSCRKS